jgi:membrane fusion protein (multidrug efflux system)
MVQNPKGKLIAGSFARVNLQMNTNSKTIIIPPHALVPVLGGQSVVLARGGKAFFQKVEIGVRTATEVEIISGIQPNDTLLVSGLIQVRQGMPISVNLSK